MGAPTDRDVKRLFAASGNRCAFPKCDLHIAVDNSLIGEICHICGKRPNSPRYDPNQTDAERHAFDNLILLCANHHKVVDDDEVSYPVPRLQTIKADHEARQLGLPPDENADQIVRVLINQSVSSVGQSSGITAQNVHAGVINFHPGNPIVDPDRAEAIKILWNALAGLKSEFSDVLFTDSILLASELDDCFRGKNTNAFFNAMSIYKQLNHVPDKMRAHMPDDAERFRICISARLWSLYEVGLAFYGRTAMLLTLSFKQRRLNDWRQDSLLVAHLLSVFPPTLVEECTRSEVGGLRRIAASIDDAFLKEGRVA
jgi:hypothetical protein